MPTKWGRQDLKIKQCPWAKNILILVGEDRQAQGHRKTTPRFSLLDMCAAPRLQHTSSAAAAETCSGIIHFLFFSFPLLMSQLLIRIQANAPSIA